MKTKLSYKLFAAFVVMSFIVIALTVVSFRFAMTRNFWNFVNRSVLNHMDDFSLALEAEYETHQGWDHLRGDRDRWLALMSANIPEVIFDRPPPWHPPKPEETVNGPGTKEDLIRRPAADDPDRERNHPPRRFARSLVLFDENQKYIVGGKENSEAKRFTLRALVSGEQTIGWLGLLKMEYFSDPIMAAFIKKQSRILVYLGGVILILAALISYIFSRHLLAPVRQLAQGTKSLSSFKFSTRIDVRSKDELGQLADDFNQMADTLRKYEELRQQWISDISHELRTPLAILKGEIEALQDGIRPPDQVHLESLHSEVLRISKLVADLHDLSLADSQNLVAQKDPIKPLAILKKKVAQFSERLDQYHIDVDLSLQDDEAVIVEGDSNRMAQVFTNLLENSIRYTDPPGLLKISENHDTEWLTIYFEDSAPGVSDGALELIFERLYRLDSSRNRNKGGSGLGLAICKQIIEAHGGSIVAEQTGIGGLGIRIKLPRMVDEVVY
jgi:two-component system sensor histidine kinase BaeS